SAGLLVGLEDEPAIADADQRRRRDGLVRRLRHEEQTVAGLLARVAARDERDRRRGETGAARAVIPDARADHHGTPSAPWILSKRARSSASGSTSCSAIEQHVATRSSARGREFGLCVPSSTARL